MKEVTQEFFENFLIEKRSEILAVSAEFDFKVAKKNKVPTLHSDAVFFLQGAGIIKFFVKFTDNSEKVFYVTHTTFNGYGLNESTENEYFVEYAKEFLLELSNTTGFKIELIT